MDLMVEEPRLADPQALRLDDLPGLAQVLRHHWRELLLLRGGEDGGVAAGTLDCPSCGETKPMRLALRYSQAQAVEVLPESDEDLLRQLVPSLVDFFCVQCDTLLTAVVYQGPHGPALAVLPSCRSGLTTSHTSEGVAFYLDQALRAHSVGADSAAIAMFRTALEQILFEEGYRTGTLALKVHQLCENIEAHSAPKWALDLEADFLSIIQELGSASIHPDDGDVRRQAAFERNTFALVEETFRMLLFLVYEVPHQRNARLAALRAKSSALKR